MAPPFSAFIRVRDVLASIRSEVTNLLSFQLGDVLSDVPESNEAELWQQPGFASLPADPTPGQSAAQFLVITRGDRDFAIAGRDKRAADIYKNLKPGDTCIYATSGMARLVLKGNGDIVLLTTDTNEDSGRTIFFRLSPNGVLGTPEIRLHTPFFELWIDGTGFHAHDRSGAKIDFGSLGAPDPISALSAILTLTASTLNLKGTVKVGAGPVYMQGAVTPTPEPVPSPTNPTAGSTSLLVSVP
jgi:hypothetical protein